MVMPSEKTKISILGFGVVGQGFFELFHKKRKELHLEDVRISEIIDLKYGHIINPDEGIISNLRPKVSSGDLDVIGILEKSEADILCEFTWVNFKDGEPGISHIRKAFSKGMDVITSNKGPVALFYNELRELAEKEGRKFRIKGTVMAGTPSFNVMELLPGATVKSVRGIFNGTTNYMLLRMGAGLSFDDALREAQEKGYAEADPTNDVDGYDAGAKVAILSSIFGWKRSFKDVEIKGIRSILGTKDMAGYKLVGYADREKAYVKPMKLNNSDILAHVTGVTNAIQFETDTLGTITVTGPGAGKIETAQAALTDLVDMLKK